MTEATETAIGDGLPERASERTSVMLTPTERAAVDFVRNVHDIGSIPDVLRQYSVADCVQIYRRAVEFIARAA